MQTYPAGVTVTLTIPLIDHNGDPVTPVELSYSVSDLEGVELVARTGLDFAANDTDADVRVEAAFNALEPGVPGGRVVHLFIKAADGTHVREIVYGLRPFQRLIPGTNSFVTDAAAQVLAADIPGLDGLTGAEATERQGALLEAHTRITRIRFRVPFTTPVRGELLIDRSGWEAMTPAEFARLPASFKRTLTRAQLHEANTVLTGDPIGAKRRAGILSETIGESSMMFQGGAAPRTVLSSAEALAELTGYLVYGGKTQRC